MRRVKLSFVWALVLATVVCSAACAGSTGAAGTTGSLDLDYIERDAAAHSEAEATPTPWYAWFTEAFSFGNPTGSQPASQQTVSATPDSVQEFYEQGAGTAPTERPAATAPASPGSAETTPFRPETTSAPNRTTPKPGESAAPSPTPVPTPTPKDNTVTMSIRCDTAVNNGMHLEAKWAGIVPASGCILDATEFEIEDGDTVLDVLIQARDKYKLHMEYSGTKSGAYVEGINNLYEFDGGRWSGWMYCVNGWYPNYGCGVYYLKPGDKIEWNYTCDLGLDLDSTWWEGAQEWKDTHE